VKPVERVEEKQLLATLHEEGLIQRPIGRGAFFVSYEVMSELSGDAGARRPPPRLPKIRDKLERAERRRQVFD